MELYEKILCEAIAKEVIPGMRLDSEKLLELKCYQAIREIYEVISDEDLDDAGCFYRVEQIVWILEKLGIGGGGRHDF